MSERWGSRASTRTELRAGPLRVNPVIERCIRAEGSCMSGKGISTVAHGMIGDALRPSRRRFLTQAGAAGLVMGVPMSTTIAQETQRSSVGDGKEVSLGEKL